MPIKIYKTKHRNIQQLHKAIQQDFLMLWNQTQKENTKTKHKTQTGLWRVLWYICEPSLPVAMEDLDALVSITSDKDLANLIKEYDKAVSPTSSLKIRAFLSPSKPPRKSISSPLPPPIPNSSTSSSKSSSLSLCSTSSSCSTLSLSHSPIGTTPRFSMLAANMCLHQISLPITLSQRFAAKIKPHCAYCAYGNPSNIYLIHNGNH